MTIYRIQAPDGSILRIEGPEGATQEQLIDVAKSNWRGTPSAAEQIANDPITKGAQNFAQDMPGVQKFAAGAGKAGYDLTRGAGQLIGIGPSPEEMDQTKKLDAPLMKTGAGMAGNIAGNVSAFAPTAFIPGANTYTGAALAGSAMGALAPVGTDDSRLTNALVGGGAGIVGQGAGRLLGRALRPVSNALSPEEQKLAQAALKEGIPLRASQATGSKPLAIAESVMENLPLTSGSQLAGKRAQQEAFNRAVLSRAGVSGNVATPEVLAAQKASVGGELGDIAKRNVLNFSDDLMEKLANIADDAGKHLPPKKAAEISSQVDQILSQVENGTMAGTNYQGWRQPLNALAKKGDEFSSYYGQIKKALDTAFREQLPGAEGETFRELSRKYANLKVINQTMGGQGLAQTVGDIPPAQLASALAQSVGREGKALGRGDLNELTKIGRRFISSNVPDSGTAQRQMIQALLTSGGGAAIGAGGAAATGHDPMAGAGYGLAAGGASLLAPKLAQSLMNSGAGQAYLKRGAVALTEAQRKAISHALRLGTLGAAQGQLQ